MSHRLFLTFLIGSFKYISIKTLKLIKIEFINLVFENDLKVLFLLKFKTPFNLKRIAIKIK